MPVLDVAAAATNPPPVQMAVFSGNCVGIWGGWMCASADAIDADRVIADAKKNPRISDTHSSRRHDRTCPILP